MRRAHTGAAPPTRRDILMGRTDSATVRVAETCLEERGVSCRLCEDACDEQAIRMRPMLQGRNRVHVDPEACTLCGLCLAVCPVDAILVPDQPEEA